MLACFRPFRRDAAERCRQRVSVKHILRYQRNCYDLCLHYLHHYNATQAFYKPHYIQGIRTRLKQKKKIQGGFTAASSHTNLSTHL